MKHYCLCLLLMLPLLICSCGGDNDSEADETAAVFITPAVTEVEMLCTDTYKEINVESNTDWSAHTDEAWLSCSKMGDNKLAIATSMNTSWTDDRRAEILLNDKNGVAKARITVRQAKRESAPFKTFTVNGVEFKMIVVEGGTFKMGATLEQRKYTNPNSNEYPAHQVTLNGFLIGQTEVTQALWYAVMGEKPSSDWRKWTSQEGLGDNYPAYYISNIDCQEFIEKLNSMTGEAFRMPTEAEWEYAARGGNKSRGFVFSGSDSVDGVAWYCLNSREKVAATHEVMALGANELGIYDMSGNLFEWVSDWHTYTDEPQINPSWPSGGAYHIVRGGSWCSTPQDCRVSSRGIANDGEHSNVFGLRLALSENQTK